MVETCPAHCHHRHHKRSNAARSCPSFRPIGTSCAHPPVLGELSTGEWSCAAVWGHLFVIPCRTPLVMADTVGRASSPSAAPQPSSGVDRSCRDGCGIDEGDGGAEPRATGVLARSLAGPSHCAHSRQWRRSSCATRVAHICENRDVPSSCMSSEIAVECEI